LAVFHVHLSPSIFFAAVDKFVLWPFTLQDDMQLSPDFFSFFEATAPILDADPSLYCVSSWNDHGQVCCRKDCCQNCQQDPQLPGSSTRVHCIHFALLHYHQGCRPPLVIVACGVQDRFVSNATQLYRSDFFPGLGWMLNRRVWQSVKDNWCVTVTVTYNLCW
jgi:alpha-1,3-mannosyl-glycoprotein beta-1,2-N-acetylglucosaminyltransferase